MENSLIDISIDELTPQVESLECSKLRERIAASRRLESERHSILEALLTENEKLKAEKTALKAELAEKDGGHEKHINENSTLKQKAEEIRHELELKQGHIKELLEANDAIKGDNIALKAELASKSEEYQLVYTQKVELEALEQLWKEGLASMNVAPYVLVLIDGNEHTFVDALYGKATDGGAETGLRLRDEIASRIQSQYNCRIITNVYVDFEGLLSSGKLPRSWNAASLRKFFIGFTQVQTGFQVVDTGPGPGEATIKLKEMLDLFVNNVQCKHIYYACGSDAKSLSTLDDYRDNFILRSSITLIKSSEYKDPHTYLPFEILELPSLLKASSSTNEAEYSRVEDVGPSRNGLNYSPKKNGLNHSPKKARLDSTRPRPMPKFRSQIATAVPGSSWASHSKSVLLNIHDQRVDSVVETSDRHANESFALRTKKGKLCVYFHVLGACFNNPCRFSHEPRLNSKELDILIARVRCSPCDKGSACRSTTCFYGHACPSTYCAKGDECPFRFVHGIDKQVVRVWDPKASENVPPMRYNSPSPEQTSELETDADPRLIRPMPSLFAPRNPNIPDEPVLAKILNAEPYYNRSPQVKPATSGAEHYRNHSPKIEQATSDADRNHSPKIEQATSDAERYRTHSFRVEQATPGAEQPYKRYFTRPIGA